MIRRPKPINGESWPGYMLRLAQINHLQGIAGLAARMNSTFPKMMAATPNVVLKALGINHQIETKRIYREGTLQMYYQFSRHGRSVRGRICPLCISSPNFSNLESSWDRIFQFECLIHRVVLKDQCHGCGHAITYKRLKIEECECGSKFAESPTVTSLNQMRSLYRIAQLEEVYSVPAKTFGLATWHELEALRSCKSFKRFQNIEDKKRFPFDWGSDGFFTSDNLLEINRKFVEWQLQRRKYQSS